MLNKRFKIAKCKTSLKLATSRIKLMKNKKGIQINQMKRELAQLLESGQDRTARIRVEHVIREEKMVAAYDLIKIYCELIVARLPIIESQKTCHIDLKEAITSVIFAAPRCSDIPELIDARKNFTAKYGKEFVSAALELRPDSGVSRMIVEKLSAVAPDVQTKVKVLSGIAKEHNVNWEPTLFEETESKPLNGPVNFEQESMMKVNPPEIQIPNVQNVQSHEEKLNVPDDFSQQNRRYTLGTHNISSNDMRPSGTDSDMFNKRHSFHSNSNKSSSNRENNWNMEFKDATSAAQAAAESAERASLAARAAAQLSSQGKITRQYSTESHNSKDSYNSSFNNRNPKLQNPQTDPNEDNTSPKATNEVIRTRKPQVSTTPEVPSQHRNPKLQNPQTDPNTSPKATKPVIRKQPSYKDDETDSDDDDHKSDMRFDYNEGQAKSFFPSPGRESESTHISSPRKNRIELNDLVERGSHVYDDEDSKLQFRYESKKNDIEPEILEKNSELKFGTLTGGLRNKGGVKYPPYTKNTSSPSSKKLVEDKESQIKVNQKSEPTSFSRSEKKKPSVSMSSSESDSDDQNDKFVKKNRSRFAPPDVFFNDDFEEEVSPVFKPTSAGRAGLSRRTKDNVEVEGKTVISSKHDSTNGSSSPKISEQPQNTRKTEETKTSDLGSKTSIDVNKLKKPSHVHPKLPDYDSLAARMQSLRANHK